MIINPLINQIKKLLHMAQNKLCRHFIAVV